ncbi:hypothetical protein CSUI_002818 [Cystoisospora suis]|uniref:Transmembrane protein n=1 Tax=Cystoisospora suis TaxID=483139 RepID=A0A2C6KSK8_9APIC|nr:hypothetical protein CSUI_002818 [Cystoisospora suis]
MFLSLSLSLLDRYFYISTVEGQDTSLFFFSLFLPRLSPPVLHGLPFLLVFGNPMPLLLLPLLCGPLHRPIHLFLFTSLHLSFSFLVLLFSLLSF